MKRRLCLATCCAILGFATFSTAVHADVVFGNLGSSGTGAVNNTNFGVSNGTPPSSAWLMQGFTVGGSNTILQTVTLGLSDSEATTAQVQIFANSAGLPIGTALGTQTVSITANSPPTRYTFDFGLLQLISGSSYWVVVSPTAPDSLFNWNFNTAEASTSEQNASGWSPLSPSTKRSEDSGQNWIPTTLNQAASISITAVPEPSTYAMAAVGAGLLILSRRRRKAANLAAIG